MMQNFLFVISRHKLIATIAIGLVLVGVGTASWQASQFLLAGMQPKTNQDKPGGKGVPLSPSAIPLESPSPATPSPQSTDPKAPASPPTSTPPPPTSSKTTPQPAPKPSPSPKPATPPSSPTPTAPIGFTVGSWNSSYSDVIRSDVTQSITLPSGHILWVGGDTIRINNTSTNGPYGYPHSAFVKQAPGTLNFTPVPGNYGYGWQQVPNWSDGSWFWPATPIVDGSTLYVLGQRVKVGNPFVIVGSYVAKFNASTLAYQSIVALPNGATGTTSWGGFAKTSTGWWITGTHPVSCSYATYCKVGDMAKVPFGSLATSANWQVYNNVIPATANVGTTLALIQSSTGWSIFTKVGDGYGGTEIERLTASTPTGPWTVGTKWAAPSAPGTVTYGVAVHPEQAAPAGQVLVSYNVNGVDASYYPLFLYLPK